MSETETTKEKFPQIFTPIDQRLFESRHIFVNGIVNGEMAFKINRELLALEHADKTKPIIMWINSPGGEVYSGFSIYDTIQFIKPKVLTIVSGTAASMGSVIALAANKENRFILPHGKILLHQPLIGGTLKGPASDLEIHARDIIQLKKKMHQLYSERTGTDIETYERLMERDYWVDPEEAVTLGLVSRVIHSQEEIG